MDTVRSRSTAFMVTNLHCPSCVTSIETALARLKPPPFAISHSIVQHTVTVTHPTSLSVDTITAALEDEGYEVSSVIANPLSSEPRILKENDDIPSEPDLERPSSVQRLMSHASISTQKRKQQRHRDNCTQCQLEETKEEHQDLLLDGDTKDHGFVVIDSSPSSEKFTANLTLDGMTCASCVGTVELALLEKPWVESASVNLLMKSATVVFTDERHANELVSIIDDAGYDAALEQVEKIQSASRRSSQSAANIWRATYSIGGMTCSSCVAIITDTLKNMPWVQSVNVNLVGHSAAIVFEGKTHLNEIGSLIEDIGYDAKLNEVTGVDQPHDETDLRRTVQIRIDGMYCDHCPTKIVKVFEDLDDSDINIEEGPSLKKPVLKLSYTPNVPTRTIRGILTAVSAADSALQPSIYHPMTIEERSQRMHVHEQRRILYRLLFSIIVAIPTLVIGIVFMSLVSIENAAKKYLMSPLGGASRAEWALFIMATPVYFCAADIFHRRMLKELRALWRRRSPTPILKRFYRFGSMNMLISLGTTIAYVSSIAELAIDASNNKENKTMDHVNPTYFDSVVFLTMFLLIGRYIEAHSKAKTGDAVSMLGKLRPTEALLFTGDDGDNVEKSESNFTKVNVDLLERGDTVRVPNGASPPCDGVVTSGSSKFDESSLTGESRPVTKQIGDSVFSGTVNQGSAISIRITGVAGNSMLDRIMMVVREGQTRRAPVERVADRITGYFVPFICLVGVTTFVVWLGLGLSGKLPVEWRDTTKNWAFWSLQFAIAVFIVACPCGIGLAAPTALFVGGGLAAHFGILVKGGGEAFQEASTLDCIVFDKTGTLTEGGEPVVTDYLWIGESLDEETVLAAVKAVEEDSSHPIARAVVNFCKDRTSESFQVKETSEIAGRGMKASGSPSTPDVDLAILIGNETLMHDYAVPISTSTAHSLTLWKTEAKSVVLVAIKPATSTSWTLASIFSISDPIRPEAAHVIRSLQARNIDIWMISGDNPITAHAIGTKLNIAPSNIIAGVLPEQKAEKVKWLQASPSKRHHGRTTVAMVGDGINDSPALTNSDVGIAIGSGSDVAISAAAFVLLTSDLMALLTLIDLSRVVFRRIKFNFFWALVYNCAALPIAAGVLFPVKTGGGGHVRLDPAWAALAMALSSVSVVCSSLMLRSKVPGVGFRAAKRVEEGTGGESVVEK